MLRSTLRRVRARRVPATPPSDDPFPQDPHYPSTSEEDRRIADAGMPHSMTGRKRLLANIDAVRHVVRRDVPGDIVECGVWRGGSVLVMVLTLQSLGVTDRDVWLYDTFEGMTEPTAHDTSPVDKSGMEWWEEGQESGVRAFPHFFEEHVFNEDYVRSLLTRTGYPQERLHFVRGPVEETIPGAAPDQIALLRLDTDWYESTKHELLHLYPRLSERGVLILDDYGHWDGARRAVDEYFATEASPLLMARLDYAARIGVKL